MRFCHSCWCWWDTKPRRLLDNDRLILDFSDAESGGSRLHWNLLSCLREDVIYVWATIAMGWTVRGSNPDWCDVFRIGSDWPWGPPNLLYKGHRVSVPGIKRPGRGVNHPSPSGAEVKQRLEQCLYSPSGPSGPILGRTLPYLNFRLV